MFPFFLALYNGSQVSIVALWATCYVYEDNVDHYRINLNVGSVCFRGFI